MATRLTKPIERRIGDYVVRLTETHLEIRRVRHRRGVRVALAELIAAADGVRPPRGWIPSTGETVAVLPWRHRSRVASIIQAVPELLVRVAFRRGTERIVELSSLVPVENERIVVQCERTPRRDSIESDRTLF